MFQSLHRDVANLYIKCCIFESLWCNIGVVVYQPPLPGVISRKARGHVVCVGGGGGGGMIRGLELLLFCWGPHFLFLGRAVVLTPFDWTAAQASLRTSRR
jgi:hypothetical protein